MDENKDLDSENSDENDKDRDFEEYHCDSSSESGTNDNEDRIFLGEYYIGKDSVEKGEKTLKLENRVFAQNMQ